MLDIFLAIGSILLVIICIVIVAAVILFIRSARESNARYQEAKTIHDRQVARVEKALRRE